MSVMLVRHPRGLALDNYGEEALVQPSGHVVAAARGAGLCGLEAHQHLPHLSGCEALTLQGLAWAKLAAELLGQEG